MNWLNTLSIRKSVLIFVAIAAVNAVGLGALAVWQMTRTGALSEELNTNVLLAGAAGQTVMFHDRMRGAVLEVILAGRDKKAAAIKVAGDSVAGTKSALLDSFKTFETDATSPELKAALTDIRPAIEQYSLLAADIAKTAVKDVKGAEEKLRQFNKDFEALEQRLAQIRALVEKDAAKVLQHRDALYARLKIINSAAVVLSLTLLSIFSLQFSRSIIRRLGAEPLELSELAKRIAHGDLGTRFDAQNIPHGSVADAMVIMRDTLRDTVSSIRESSGSVANASSQIASGNQELSSRTERQAARLQQVASSMEEMNSIVRQTADRARVVSQLADDASQVAQRGGASVKRVVSTMSEIQDSSRKIAEIINVIDSIAFQTNILALNAAVEAARAGDQGRGFAVVAGEVRNLAQRSAGAAKEIKSLISDSVERVDTGNRTVIEAGTTMEEIVTGVRRVTELISEIRVATTEQDQGVASITDSVSELDKDTQGNAALVEETAAAADSLSQQAQALSQTVSVFKLKS